MKTPSKPTSKATVRTPAKTPSKVAKASTQPLVHAAMAPRNVQIPTSKEKKTEERQVNDDGEEDEIDILGEDVEEGSPGEEAAVDDGESQEVLPTPPQPSPAKPSKKQMTPEVRRIIKEANDKFLKEHKVLIYRIYHF